MTASVPNGAVQTRCNALAWNPMEAFNFTVGNEDCCCYTFDMRKLKSARCVHKVGSEGTAAPWSRAQDADSDLGCRRQDLIPASQMTLWSWHSPQDFVSAVMDVDYSPTGREFVAGGYDRSVRIFSHQGKRSPTKLPYIPACEACMVVVRLLLCMPEAFAHLFPWACCLQGVIQEKCTQPSVCSVYLL